MKKISELIKENRITNNGGLFPGGLKALPVLNIEPIKMPHFPWTEGGPELIKPLSCGHFAAGAMETLEPIKQREEFFNVKKELVIENKAHNINELTDQLAAAATLNLLAEVESFKRPYSSPAYKVKIFKEIEEPVIVADDGTKIGPKETKVTAPGEKKAAYMDLDD